jgi:hypothetical protein
MANCSIIIVGNMFVNSQNALPAASYDRFEREEKNGCFRAPHR